MVSQERLKHTLAGAGSPHAASPPITPELTRGSNGANGSHALEDGAVLNGQGAANGNSNGALSESKASGDMDEAAAAQLAHMQRAVAVLLAGLGEDVNRDGLYETPKVCCRPTD